MKTRIARLVTCVALALALLTSTGCASGLLGERQSTTSSGGGAVSAVAPGAPEATVQDSANNAPTTSGGVSQKTSATSADRLVVMNAAVHLRVDDLGAAIASIRTLTQTVGGTISQLTVNADTESPTANAAQSTSSTPRMPGPASASLTLRVPAQSLAGVQAKVSALGRLISQSSSESDVTQQHIDMSARLTNLRAEEARLRGLLARAGKVTELLAVERELSRVRGDIESMQAQLAYLESQAAMATLTVSMDQPGPVVRPSSGGWGIVDAITSGVQGAVQLVRIVITAVIALSPLVAIVALFWWFFSWRARRRRAKSGAQPPQAAPTAVPQVPGPPATAPQATDNDAR